MTKRKKRGREHWLLHSLDGLAYGVFVSLVLGQILITFGNYFNWPYLINWGETLRSLVGPAIGVGIAWTAGASGLTLLSAALSGSVLSTSGEGWVLLAYLAILLSIVISQMIEGKTPLDIFLIPMLSLLLALLFSQFASPYVNRLIHWLALQIGRCTSYDALWMGMLVSAIIGLVSISPIMAISISAVLSLDGLAAGAAIAGICSQMLGLAIMSVDDNDIGDVIAIGIGTPLLQFKNVLLHPLVLVPTILTSLMTGALSACVFEFSGTTAGAGLGMMAFAGPLSIVEVMGAEAWLGIILVDILLPILIGYSFYRFFKKIGWIHPGDLRLEKL